MTSRLLHFVAPCICALTFAGCKAKELGANISPTHASKVDRTWVLAARSCWPSLLGISDEDISDSLRDPIAFRGTFAGYAPLVDADVESIAEHDIMLAPAPNRDVFGHANLPLLSRQEASTERAARRQVVSAGEPPQVATETLCAIHSGTPVGFR